MISKWHARLRWLRRIVSRSEWLPRLLQLPRLEDGAPGLVMIQIDGFSRTELEKALEKNEMPFLRKLLEREQYDVRTMYTGLPSNTPAVQGELFYGVPCAVPAFSFFHRKQNKIYKMLDSGPALDTERGLAKQGEGLLKGGSSYGNVYTGGASEPRWCAASMGWGTSTRAPGPLLLLLMLALNAYGFLRALAFGVMEFFLALWDALRGVRKGESVKHEFKFILTRVAICILLREWATGAAKMDVNRGLPRVHLNLLGYDEQAHRRGPESAFAHWVLKGIDDSIKRVWTAAMGSHRREYQVWIYSDHGQVRSKPYLRIMGMSLGEKVRELWLGEKIHPPHKPWGGNVEMQRVRYLGGRWLQKLFPIPKNGDTATPYPMVADLGPLAHVYLEPGTKAPGRREFGKKLADEAGIPIVLERGAGKSLRGWTAEGAFQLPRDAEKIFGEHPFLRQLIPDVQRLCAHEHAGDLILFGWKGDLPIPVTFAEENGSHGGISPEECTAFVMMPKYVERVSPLAKDLRPMDLRRAVLKFLGRVPSVGRKKGIRGAAAAAGETVKVVKSSSSETAAKAAEATDEGKDTRGSVRWPEKTIRVMTYNVHSCVGIDGRLSPSRIADVIFRSEPDVVALQELETSDSGDGHQADEIADWLRFEYHFHSVREVEDGQFGNAVLSRFPLKLLRAGGLPGTHKAFRREPRGALWVELDVEGVPLQLLTTHLGLLARERMLQVRALLGERWLGSRDPGIPLIFCGDLNCGPRSATFRLLEQSYHDCQLQPENHQPRNTWFSAWPVNRIDHILITDSLKATKVRVPLFHQAVMASDHLPLVADIAVPGGGETPVGKKEAAQPAAGNEEGIDN